MCKRSLSVALLLALFLGVVPAKAQAYDMSRFKKVRTILGVELKGITYSDGELLTLYGARSKRFITENWYWGEAGYGAITGSRSGYIEGGLNIGYQKEWVDKWMLDYALFFGAGGGGRDQTAEGQGLIAYPSLALGYRMNKQLCTFLHMGYFSYLNGNLSGTWIGLNLSYDLWMLDGQ
jgi:hypothetical protein